MKVQLRLRDGRMVTPTDDLVEAGGDHWLRVEVAGTIHAAPSVAPARRRRRCGEVRWLGVRWTGRPWPLRWRLVAAWPTYVPSRGCGCLLVPKAMVEIVRLAWRAARAI